MTFTSFLAIAIGCIQLTKEAISLYQIFINKNRKNEIAEKDWINYKKRFKSYVEKHPELEISIIAPKKKGLAITYKFSGDNNGKR